MEGRDRYILLKMVDHIFTLFRSSGHDLKEPVLIDMADAMHNVGKILNGESAYSFETLYEIFQWFDEKYPERDRFFFHMIVWYGKEYDDKVSESF